MNRISKNIMIISGILVIIAAALSGSILYVTHYKVAVVDTAQSADGNYELILQSVGEPAFPFGSASGSLVLKSGEIIVAKADFKINNDGSSFSEQAWSVTWFDDYVEIVLSGSEQYDELLTLYYDGQVEKSRLTTHYGVEAESVSGNIAEEATDTEDHPEFELFPDEWRITAGYKAIYEFISGSTTKNFEVYYGASESSTKCVLSEDENTVDYLVYDGESANENCGLYVCYQSEKNADGTWSYTDGIIINIYAYVYENGDVVSSGKRNGKILAQRLIRK